jgi:hypothetical protein
MNPVDENDDYEGGIEEFIYSIDEGYIENVENHADEYGSVSYFEFRPNSDGYYYFVLGGWSDDSGKGIGVISPQPEIEIFGEESLQYLTSNGFDNLGYPIKLFTPIGINEEQKKWLVFDSNIVVANLSGREYKKANQGYALTSLCFTPSGKYISPLLVGESKDSVEVLCTHDNRICSTIYSFTYKNKIWYCSGPGHAMGGTSNGSTSMVNSNYSKIFIGTYEESISSTLSDEEYYISLAKRFLDMYFSGASYFPKTYEDFN